MSDPSEEEADANYVRGQRAVWTRLLQTCLVELGYSGRTMESLAIEREETVAALRSVCEEWGDNSWDDELHLADVVEKYLHNNLFR